MAKPLPKVRRYKTDSDVASARLDRMQQAMDRQKRKRLPFKRK